MEVTWIQNRKLFRSAITKIFKSVLKFPVMRNKTPSVSYIKKSLDLRFVGGKMGCDSKLSISEINDIFRFDHSRRETRSRLRRYHTELKKIYNVNRNVEKYLFFTNWVLTNKLSLTHTVLKLLDLCINND